ncbi:MAG: PAS domain S-box protein [Candidatus Neomarinimicrobiota bacterium]|nr:MAG: PAS domain S-box protein [Candidatus Neomarinimicrobiota bacterium]
MAPAAKNRPSSDLASILHSIINSPQDVVIFALDRNYCYTAFNENHRRTIKQIWGTDIEVGLNMLEVIQDPADREKARVNFDRALAGDAFTLIEEYGAPPHRYVYEDRYSPVRDEAGDIIGLSVFLTDVTEQQRTEAELKHIREHLEELVQERTAELRRTKEALEQDIETRTLTETRLRLRENQLRLIFDSVGDILYFLAVEPGPVYRFLQVNQAFLRATGLTEDQIVGKTVQEVIPPQSQDLVLARYAQAVRENRIVYWEETSPYPAGLKTGIVSIAPVLNEEGTCTHLVGSVHDITERKIKEEELRRTLDLLSARENQLDVTLRSIGDAVIATDTQGNVILMNPVAEELTGWTEAEARGKPLSQVFRILNERTRRRMTNPVARVLKRGRIVGLANHTVLVRKDGQELPIADSAAPIKNERNDIIGVVLVFRDQTQERQVKQAVEESLLRLRRAELAAKTGNWELHLDTGTIIGSEGAGQIYGVRGEQFTYESIREIPLPEYRPVLDAALKALIEKGTPYDIEFKIRAADTGEIKDIRSRAFFDADRRMVFGTIQDITAEKRIQADILALQEFNQSILQGIAEGLIVMDARSRIEYLNPAAEQILGYSREQLLGQSVDTILPEDQRPILQQQDELRLQGKSSVYELQMVRPDGRRVDLRISGSPRFRNGNLIGTMAVFTDITESKRVQERLRESEAKFRHLIMNAPTGILTIDRNGNILEVNPKLLEIMGSPSEEATKQINMFTFPPLREAGISQNFQEVIETGDAIHMEHEYVSKWGKKSWLRYTIVPIFDEEKTIVGAQANIEDVSREKQATEELNTLANALKSVRECVSITDESNRLIFVNDAFVQTYGYSREELLGHSVDLIQSPLNDPELNQTILSQTKAGGWQGELINRDKNGRDFPIHLSTSPVRDEQGHTIALIGVAEDITERKQAEERLQRTLEQLSISENRLKTIIETEPECVKILAPDGTLEHMNAAGLAMIEADSLEQVQHQSVLPLVAPPYRPAFREMVEKVMGGSTEMLEFEIVGLRGTHRWLETHSAPLHDAQGHISGLLGVTRDITDRKRMEEMLIEEETRMRMLVEGTPYLFFYTQDLDGKFTYISPSVESITGYTVEEWMQPEQNWFLTDSEINQRARERTRIHLQGKRTEGAIPLEIIHKQGHILQLEIYEHPVFQQGQVVGIQGVAHDITERQRALEEAQQANRVKDLFLANMSHEIRTPLNSIVGFSELLESALSDRINQDEQHFFDIIRSSSDRLMNTVHEILDISLIESGTYRLNRKPHDLVAMTRSIIDQYAPAALDKELELSFRSTRKTAPIITDEYGLERILNNLIDNAVKYTPSGSVSVRLSRHKPHYILTIRDTGIGISPEYLPRLYDIFSQESVGYTKKFQGIGLGMSLVKKYSDLLGIQIQVESSKGIGTTFTLTIPEQLA